MTLSYTNALTLAMLARDKNTYVPFDLLGIIAHVFLPVVKVLPQSASGTYIAIRFD